MDDAFRDNQICSPRDTLEWLVFATPAVPAITKNKESNHTHTSLDVDPGDITTMPEPGLALKTHKIQITSS